MSDASTEIAPAVISETSAVIIPLQNHEEFYALPAAERERVLTLLRICAQVKESPAGVVTALRCAAPACGMTFSNLKTLYYAHQAQQDWTVFVRRHKGPTKLPPDFVDEVKRRMLGNCRSLAQAIQSIRNDFAAGLPIPGYGTWREWYQQEFPYRDLPPVLTVFPGGWGRSNLYTKAPTKAQRMLKIRGWAAAKRHMPHVMRDMSQLRFLELIIIDDFVTDIEIQARNPATGRLEIVVCRGLLAIDGATRRILAWALKPQFTKSAKEQEETGSKRHSITQQDVKELLFSVFSGHGLPAEYGVTILCENAAASISADFEMALESLFGVQVARTGLMAREVKTLKNGFVQEGGKPFEKGWIEATFNITWNMAGALPGQKGATYQLKPADHAAKMLYALRLLNAEGLSDEQRSQLRVQFFTQDEALAAFDLIFRALDNRTKHELQGFEEIVGYRLPDGSAVVDRDTLNGLPLTREEVRLCTPEPRMESPMERWTKITSDVRFLKVPEHRLALLLLSPRKVTIEKHAITFTHLGKGFTFFDADSPVMALPEGTELLGYFDGINAGFLHCTHLDGRDLGSVKRRGPVDIRNHKLISEEAGAVTHLITKHVLNPVRTLCAAEDQQLGADDAHNREVFKQAGVAYPFAPKIPKPLPPSGDVAPAALSNGLAPEAPGIPATPQGASRPAAAKPLTLSQKLGRRAPARDAFTAHQEALAQRVAAAGKQVQERAERALQLKEDGGKITADEIAAATGAEPAAGPAPETFSPEEISDLLSD